VEREAAGVEREAAGAQREEDGAQREAGLEESILRSAGEGIARLDTEGVVTFANPAASRMTGYAAGDLEGRFLHGRPTNLRADGSAYLAEVYPSLDISTHGLQDADTFWRKDGTSFPVEFTSTPIIEDGDVQGEVIVFKDITDRREAERAKSEFTSVVSHELRTPLTSIRGSLGLLESGVLGALPEKGQRMIEIAVENTDRLVRLINDILDMERIDSGSVDMRTVPTNALDLIERVVEEMRPFAHDAGVKLAADPMPVALTADPDRVLQVLTNLISNAIKFSEPETTVVVSSELSEGMALFQVSDSGRGIPAEKLESIFERFSQVDASDSREMGGTGLGLSICHTIVEHHGGRIWVESELGRGSAFTFVLPLERIDDLEPTRVEDEGEKHSAVTPGADDDRDEAEPAVIERGQGEQVVLIVEDDLDLADVLAATLRRHGIKTFTAATGPIAISLSQQVRPDLLVLDVGLPETDGYEVVGWLRRHESLSSLPIVVYTAQDLDEESRDRLRLGETTEFLTKARVSPEAFEERVTNLLGLDTNDQPTEALNGA
jgi:PAS domain S-box-containing protein